MRHAPGWFDSDERGDSGALLLCPATRFDEKLTTVAVQLFKYLIRDDHEEFVFAARELVLQNLTIQPPVDEETGQAKMKPERCNRSMQNTSSLATCLRFVTAVSTMVCATDLRLAKTRWKSVPGWCPNLWSGL